MKHDVKYAYISTALRQIIYGLSIFFTTKLLSSVPIFDVLSLRFLITFIVMFILKATGAINVKFELRRFKMVLPTLLFEPIIYFTFESIGLSMTSTLLAGIILGMAPAFTIFAEMGILKEKNSVYRNIMIILSMLGGIYITLMTSLSDTNRESSLFGILFIVLAMLSECLFVVKTRGVSERFRASEVTYYYSMTGAVVFNVINIILHLKNGNILVYFEPLFNIQNAIGFFYLSVITSVLTTYMTAYALSKVKASNLMAFSGINTIVTILVSVLVAGDELKYYHVIGTVLIIIGTRGIVRDKKKSI